jgi:hypothetical protein
VDFQSQGFSKPLTGLALLGVMFVIQDVSNLLGDQVSGHLTDKMFGRQGVRSSPVFHLRSAKSVAESPFEHNLQHTFVTFFQEIYRLAERSRRLPRGLLMSSFFANGKNT